jgi:predicted nucleic acid-binding protein
MDPGEYHREGLHSGSAEALPPFHRAQGTRPAVTIQNSWGTIPTSEDERTDVTATLLYRVAETGALVPALWRLEVANGLQVAVRRGRIDVTDATIADLRDLAIDVVDPETDRKGRISDHDRFRLTLYDAAYLELAQRRQLPLASLDNELRAAGQMLGVPLWACERTGGGTWPAKSFWGFKWVVGLSEAFSKPVVFIQGSI